MAASRTSPNTSVANRQLSEIFEINMPINVTPITDLLPSLSRTCPIFDVTRYGVNVCAVSWSLLDWMLAKTQLASQYAISLFKPLQAMLLLSVCRIILFLVLLSLHSNS